jgi:hypothetical protein
LGLVVAVFAHRTRVFHVTTRPDGALLADPAAARRPLPDHENSPGSEERPSDRFRDKGLKPERSA